MAAHLSEADRPALSAGSSAGGQSGRTPRSTSVASTSCGLVERRAVGRGEHQLGLVGRLVGVVDAGEPGDLAGPGLGVEALGVALLALLDRRVDEDLDEGQVGRLVDRAGPLAAGAVRADQRHQRDDAGIGEQPGHLAGPAHVLVAVGGA